MSDHVHHERHNNNFLSHEQEEAFLQQMISENSFAFSEGHNLDNNQHISVNNEDDSDYSDNNYEHKRSDIQQDQNELNYSTPRGDNNNNNFIDDDDEDEDEDEEEEYSHENNERNNNIMSKNNNGSNTYKYKYLSKHHYPDKIEQLTNAKWGHYAALDKYISPWTLTYIGEYELFDAKSDLYPRWINYKYESYNTAHMLTLSVIIMILASIHTSFTTDITLLIFTIGLIGVIDLIYLAKVILTKKNHLKMIIFCFFVGIVLVIIWMVIAEGPLGLKEHEIVI
eukprot:58554_1